MVIIYDARSTAKPMIARSRRGLPFSWDSPCTVADELALLWQITHAAVRCRSRFGSADIAEDLVE